MRKILERIDLASLDLKELSEKLSEISEKSGVKIEKFRGKQIYGWLVKGVYSFDEMLNVPKSIKSVLEEYCLITLPRVEKKLVSKLDGTVKYLFRLHDGEFIESVFMRYEHGNTLCVSTQVGCRMGCSFCASTLTGLTRNLYPSEILGQVVAAQKDMGEKVSNIVMMGIGEPLDNYENVITFLKLASHPERLALSPRRISLHIPQ